VEEHVYLTLKGIVSVSLNDWSGLSPDQIDILVYLDDVGAVGPENAEHVDNIGFGLKNTELRTPLMGLWYKDYIAFV